MTPDVVRARLREHDVVAVRSSAVPTMPWTAIDLVKGWTYGCTTEELEEQVPLAPAKPAPAMPGVVTGGMAPEPLAGLADRIMRSLTTPLMPPIAEEDVWRITSHDDCPFEADPVEAWGYTVDAIDRYGFVDRIEQRVDGSWRRRSLRDLLEHAGGDPL